RLKRSASPWLAISISGTGAATPCASGSIAGSGSFSRRALGKEPSINTRSLARVETLLPSRRTRSGLAARCGHRPLRLSRGRTILSGTTTRIWLGGRLQMHGARPCLSTRSISARGGGGRGDALGSSAAPVLLRVGPHGRRAQQCVKDRGERPRPDLIGRGFSRKV